MHRALCLAGLILVAPAWADSQPAQPLADLIKDLAANDFQVRDAAIQAIERLGPKALDELRKHRNHADPEVAPAGGPAAGGRRRRAGQADRLSDRAGRRGAGQATLPLRPRFG